MKSPLETMDEMRQADRAQHEYDSSMLEAAEESLREHMARIKELEAALAQPAQEPVVQPAPGYCKNCKDYTIEEPLYAQPAQEPVAWVWKDMRGQDIVSLFEPRLNSVPLYTAPPQREWNAALDEAAARIGEIKGFGKATPASAAPVGRTE